MFSVKGHMFSVKGHMFSVKCHMFSVKGHMFSVKGHMFSVKGHMFSVKGHMFSMKGRPVKKKINQLNNQIFRTYTSSCGGINFVRACATIYAYIERLAYMLESHCVVFLTEFVWTYFLSNCISTYVELQEYRPETHRSKRQFMHITKVFLCSCF